MIKRPADIALKLARSIISLGLLAFFNTPYIKSVNASEQIHELKPDLVSISPVDVNYLFMTQDIPAHTLQITIIDSPYIVAQKQAEKDKTASLVHPAPKRNLRASLKVNSTVNDHQSVMAAAGIDQNDYQAAEYIVSHESGWRTEAREPHSGAFGLPQALPDIKMASAGSDWRTNPVTQLRWADQYARSRYGSWQKAQSFWQKKHYW